MIWWILLYIWLATATFFLLFLVFAAYRGAVDAGRVVPMFSKAMIALPLAAGAILDVAWNFTLGSLFFLEWPKNLSDFSSYTFTARLQRLKYYDDWRGTQARFWAKQLNWADPGHV